MPTRLVIITFEFGFASFLIRIFTLVWMKNNSYFWQTMINKTGSNGIVHRLNRKKSTVPASLLIHSDQQDFCYADSADRNLSLRDE